LNSSQQLRQEVDRIYKNRFSGEERTRLDVWRVLSRKYFQQWVKATDTVLDLGAGYCEFINLIQARKKYALDVNPATAQHAAPEVEVLSDDIGADWSLPDQSVDVVFTSNSFEHLPSKKELSYCLAEAWRVLRPGGLLLSMGPNIRYCYDIYWDFFDHHLPLSDKSLKEGLELAGFSVEKVVPRFLPYTMKSRMPAHPLLVRLYLSLPALWPIFGKQFLIVARKKTAMA